MALFSNDDAGKQYVAIVISDIDAKTPIKIKDGEKVTFVNDSKPFKDFKKIHDKKGPEAMEAIVKADGELVKRARKLGDLNLFSKCIFRSLEGTCYQWKEIDKARFSGKGEATISTAQQEEFSLLIFKELLASRTSNWPSFSVMYEDKKSGLKKIFPKVMTGSAWYKHFDLQFREIINTTKLPIGNFDVYDLNTPGGFMDFITKTMTGGSGSKLRAEDVFSKKDNWNPADIWLLNKNKSAKYITALKGAASTPEVNDILRTAFNDNAIVGVSLKKTHGKKLEYELVNLEINVKSQKLPDITFLDIRVDTKTKETNGAPVFEKKGGSVLISYKDAKHVLAFRSSTGTKSNIVYEYGKSGAAAQLGKIPKEELAKNLKKLVNERVPVWSKYHTNIPWSDEIEKEWNTKVALIKKQFPTASINNVFPQKGLKGKLLAPGDENNFVANLRAQWKESNGLSNKNWIMIQVIDFIYILAKIDALGPKSLVNFLTVSFYLAQKKGIKSGFGPFGKLL